MRLAVGALAFVLCVLSLFYYPSFQKLIRPSSTKSQDSTLSSEATFAQIPTDSLIPGRSVRDFRTIRRKVISYIWGRNGFPKHHMPDLVERSINDPDFSSLKNLRSIDRLVVRMDYGLSSTIYHFHPAQENHHLLLYHEGHDGDFTLGKKTISFFLEQGYSVMAFSMPLKGRNNRPVIRLGKLGALKFVRHDQLKFLDKPLRFFVEPVVIGMNHALRHYSYQDVSMVGISGGGWTTALSAALDPRISKSYPVAGTCPLFLRTKSRSEWGDFEQTDPGLHYIMSDLEMYILGSLEPGRLQVQIFNRYDPCCYDGDRTKSYEPLIQQSLVQLGGGHFSVVLDETHRAHAISPYALKTILKYNKN